MSDYQDIKDAVMYSVQDKPISKEQAKLKAIDVALAGDELYLSTRNNGEQMVLWYSKGGIGSERRFICMKHHDGEIWAAKQPTSLKQAFAFIEEADELFIPAIALDHP